MAYFFDELPSTSEALSGFIPGHEEAESERLSLGDANHSASKNLPPDQASSTNVEHIKIKAEELVKTINITRSSDPEMMASYQDKLTDKLTEKFRQFGDIMVTVYEINNTALQEKLAELTEVLNSCQQLNQELVDATQALSHLKDNF